MKELDSTMFKQFGPLLSGAELRMALGYRSAAAFERAVRLKTLGVNVFSLPGRRGKFALTIDVARWLVASSRLPVPAIKSEATVAEA